MEAEMTYLLEEQARKLENAEMLIELLKREVMALSFSDELHDRAAEKARALWAEAHPDDAEEWLRREDLMVWLMDRVERAEAVKESLTSALRDIKKNVDDWNLQDYVTIRRLVNAALRTTEETNNDTHDRPVETLLLIKELGRMSKKLDALKGSLRNIADNAAHWDTGRGPDASAFGWIHDIAESVLRTAEDSSVVDSTPAKQPEDSADTDEDVESLIDDGGDGMTHTPGPWKVTADKPRLIVEDDIGNPVCAMSLRGVYGDTVKMTANAHLIAAAPDMLEALEEVVAITENLPVCPFCGAVKTVQSHRPDCLSHEIETAIQKARGERHCHSEYGSANCKWEPGRGCTPKCPECN